VSRKRNYNFDIVSNISAGLTQVYLIIIIIIYYKNLIDWFQASEFHLNISNCRTMTLMHQIWYKKNQTCIF